MAIVAGFDVHRVQNTFDVLNEETGEVHRGRIRATPEAVRGWVGRFALAGTVRVSHGPWPAASR